MQDENSRRAVTIHLSEQMRKLRKQRGYKQADIAPFLYVDRSAYTCYESGRTRPSLETLVRLAHFYDVSLEYLLGLPENKIVHVLYRAGIVNIPE